VYGRFLGTLVKITSNLEEHYYSNHMPPFPARFYPIPSCLVLLAWASFLPQCLTSLPGCSVANKEKLNMKNGNRTTRKQRKIKYENGNRTTRNIC
jgi:hypothetical protein